METPRTSVHPATATVRSEQEAYLTLLLLCGKSDGFIGETETEEIEKTMMLKELFSGIKDHKDLINRCIEHVKTMKGRTDELISSCIPMIKNKEGVFAACVDLVLADGFLGESEKKFIENLYKKLGIGQKRAEVFIEVMLIKNK